MIYLLRAVEGMEGEERKRKEKKGWGRGGKKETEKKYLTFTDGCPGGRGGGLSVRFGLRCFPLTGAAAEGKWALANVLVGPGAVASLAVTRPGQPAGGRRSVNQVIGIALGAFLRRQSTLVARCRQIFYHSAIPYRYLPERHQINYGTDC